MPSAVVMTTPYSLLAASIETFCSITSFSTFSTGRFFGSPYPPAPGVTTRMMSPFFMGRLVVLWPMRVTLPSATATW